MTLKEWIQDNLDAEPTPRWALANTLKFMVESSLAAVTIFPFFVLIAVAVNFTNSEIPFGYTGPLALYIALAAGAFHEYWNCRLSQ